MMPDLKSRSPGHLFLTVSAGLALLLPACHKADPPAAAAADPGPPVAVDTTASASAPIPAFEDVVGTVRPQVRASLEAKVSGRIASMLAVPGHEVKAGDLLVELDAREFSSRLDQAQATLAEASRDFARTESLASSGAVSQRELDTAKARAAGATAAVEEAQTMLGYVRITAPFDGVITRRLAEAGDFATPGRALVDLEAPGALRLEADVPEALLDRIQMGQKLSVTAGPQRLPVEGVVSEIAPSGDPATRTFLVKLDLPPTPGVRAGLFGRVAVPVGEKQGVLVPSSAVRQNGQMEQIFVNTDGRAALRIVRTGRRRGDDVEILSGLSAAEDVIVQPPPGLHEGQPLTVRH